MTSPDPQSSTPARVSHPGVPLLPFQEQIISDLNREDLLCVTASGLGFQRILTVFIRAHLLTRSGSLVIVGATEWQKTLILKEILRHDPTAALPIDVTNEVSAVERIKHYRSGSCCFVTTRILVVDLLAARVKAEAIAGFFVLNAHRVTDTSGEGFAVRLFRAGNKNGFVRGFSDQPTSFGGGFSKVEKVMKALHVRNVALWPRFQKVVRDDLESSPIEVVEVCQELTPQMVLIQDAIMQVIGALIRELKKTNKIDSSDLNMESCMFKSFDEIVRRQLDKIWHTVTWKTKQIVQDLRQLRKLMAYLLRYDSVTFLSFLERLRATGPQSVWIFHDAAHTIFEQAKRRVYVLCCDSLPTLDKTSVSRKRKRGGPKNGRGRGRGRQDSKEQSGPVSAEPVLEELPKWGTLRGILQEIQRERENLISGNGRESSTSAVSDFPVLVVCKELYMCSQLQNYIQEGSSVMNRIYDEYLLARLDAKSKKEKASKGRQMGKRSHNEIDEGKSDLGEHGHAASHTSEEQALRIAAQEIEHRSAPKGGKKGDAGKPSQKKGKKPKWTTRDDSPAPLSEGDEQEFLGGPLAESTAQKSPLLSGVQFLALDAHHDFLLWETRPSFVVMHDPDVPFMRQIEVYKAENPDAQLRLYLLTYENSVEQHKYRSAIQREVDIFTDIIQNKGKITIPIDLDSAPKSVRDGRDSAFEVFGGLGQPSAVPTNHITRRAGGRQSMKKMPTEIVVDMREFASSLPGVLYQKGFKLHPITLEVGDFVLSPEVVVERKSLFDLFGSFQSGRLYNQAEAMCKHYKTPILLIEFEQDKHFSLQSLADLGDDINATNIVSKLVLLALHFPKLRLVWSRSLHATSDIFQALKTNQNEPDPQVAASVGLPMDGPDRKNAESVMNQTAVDFLRKLPGVTEGNFRRIMKACNCLADLAKMPLVELEEIMGSKKNAKVLREFLDAPCPKH